MEPSHLCMELRLGDNKRRAGKLVEDTHTLAVGKELEALLRSPMGSGNEVFSQPTECVFCHWAKCPQPSQGINTTEGRYFQL